MWKSFNFLTGVLVGLEKSFYTGRFVSGDFLFGKHCSLKRWLKINIGTFVYLYQFKDMKVFV
jgi:hypothetical protein